MTDRITLDLSNTIIKKDAYLIDILEKNTTSVEYIKNALQYITPEGFSTIADKCPNLTKLHIHHNIEIGNCVFGSFVKKCSRIEAITLRSLPNINDRGLEFLSPHLIRLKKVALVDMKKITVDGIAKFINCCSKSLEQLKLVSVFKKDQLLKFVALPHTLKTLKFSGPDFDDEVGEKLALNLQQVERLCLSCCNVSMKFIDCLKNATQSLTVLELRGTKISMAERALIQEKLPQLTKLVIQS